MRTPTKVVSGSHDPPPRPCHAELVQKKKRCGPRRRGCRDPCPPGCGPQRKRNSGSGPRPRDDDPSCGGVRKTATPPEVLPRRRGAATPMVWTPTKKVSCGRSLCYRAEEALQRGGVLGAHDPIADGVDPPDEESCVERRRGTATRWSPGSPRPPRPQALQRDVCGNPMRSTRRVRSGTTWKAGHVEPQELDGLRKASWPT